MAMSKYEAIMWEEKMKDEIKCEYNPSLLFQYCLLYTDPW
jgi:hypothetical protein